MAKLNAPPPRTATVVSLYISEGAISFKVIRIDWASVTPAIRKLDDDHDLDDEDDVDHGADKDDDDFDVNDKYDDDDDNDDDNHDDHVMLRVDDRSTYLEIIRSQGGRFTPDVTKPISRRLSGLLMEEGMFRRRSDIILDGFLGPNYWHVCVMIRCLG